MNREQFDHKFTLVYELRWKCGRKPLNAPVLSLAREEATEFLQTQYSHLPWQTVLADLQPYIVRIEGERFPL